MAPVTDLAPLHGKFVRITRPDTQHFERFGILADLGSSLRFGLIDEDGDTRIYPVDGFKVHAWQRRRVHVFWYGYGSDHWTWCKEIDGEVFDYFADLPRCASHADALAKAQRWLKRNSRSSK